MSVLSTELENVKPLRKLTSAEQGLVLANLGLARAEANRIAWVLAAPMAPHVRSGWLLSRRYYDELIDAAWIGLCVAAERYDPARGCNFSTYAFPVIRGAVQAASKDAEVRISPRCRFDRRRTAYNFSQTSLSKDDEKFFGANAIVDRPEATEEGPSEDLLTLLALTLPPRQARLVRRRVLEDETLQGLAREEGVSKERVRQIVAKALAVIAKAPGAVSAVQEQLRRRRSQERADFELRRAARLIS